MLPRGPLEASPGVPVTPRSATVTHFMVGYGPLQPQPMVLAGTILHVNPSADLSANHSPLPHPRCYQATAVGHPTPCLQ